MEAKSFTSPTFIKGPHVDKVSGDGPVGIIEFTRRQYSATEKWVVEISVYSASGPKRVVCAGSFMYDTFPPGSPLDDNAMKGLIASAAQHMAEKANQALAGSGISITHSHQDYLAAAGEILSTQ